MRRIALLLAVFVVAFVVAITFFGPIYGTLHGPGLGTELNPPTPGTFTPHARQTTRAALVAATVVTGIVALLLHLPWRSATTTGLGRSRN